MQKKADSFRSNIVFTGFAQGWVIIFNLIISILLARSLSVGGRGAYSLALLVPAFIITFFSLGIGEATAKLLGKGGYQASKVIGCLNTFLAVISVLSAAVYFAFSSFFLSILRNNLDPGVYYTAYFAVPVSLCWSGYASVLLAYGKIKDVGIGRLLNNIVFILLFLITGSLGGINVGVAVRVFIAAGFTEVVYLMLRGRRFITGKFFFDASIMKEQLNYGVKFSLGGIFANLNKRLDNFFVNAFAGTFGLGLYAVAYGVSEFILHISHVYSRVAFSYAVSSAEEGYALSAKSIRQNLYICLFAALILAAAFPYLVKAFYTQRFSSAVLPGMILLPGVVAFGLSVVSGTALSGHGFPQVNAKAMGMAAVSTVVLDIYLIPRAGIVGAAIASTLSYGLCSAYLVGKFARISGCSLTEILVFRKEDVSDYLSALKAFLEKYAKR